MEAVQELMREVEYQVDYTFVTDKITHASFGLKGDKQSFVTGYISVPEVDLYNDLITPSAMKSMLRQISEKVITLDYEHEAFRDDNTILPVGKIVEAKVDERGLWIKAKLNTHSPKYKALWGSIKDGFLNAFSIAFKPTKTVEKTIGDTSVRLIEDLILLNVALTGTPVNEGAVMTGHSMKAIMLKAIEDTKEEKVLVSKSLITLLTKSMEEKNMETKTEAELKAEEDAKVETEKAEAEEEAKKVDEAKTASDAEAAEAAKVEEKAKEDATNKVITELKALVTKQGEEIKTMKESPVFKSKLSNDDPAGEVKSISMLSLVR